MANPARVWTQPRSELTADQQRNVRARLMTTASVIAEQLGRYVRGEEVGHNGKALRIDSTRLAAYRLVLERTVPALSMSTVEHKSALETLDSAALLNRLAELVKARPELAGRLREALGERVIEAEAQEVEG